MVWRREWQSSTLRDPALHCSDKVQRSKSGDAFLARWATKREFRIGGVRRLVQLLAQKHHPHVWWVPPLAGTMAHSIVVATGFEHY
jgi:hypothetical protein